ATATALAAMAPEKPATNDVQPVRNAASGPNASRKYTYSPPALGRSADSSAYAMAPANASAPPSSQTQTIAVGLPTICATMIGTKKIPPPMTLEMTMAAASTGPSRRSSADEEAGLGEGRGARDTNGLLCQQLPCDRHALQLDP